MFEDERVELQREGEVPESVEEERDDNDDPWEEFIDKSI